MNAAKQTTLKEVGEMLGYVVENMVTKDDLAAVRSELKGDIASVKNELKADIATLSVQVTSIEQELKSIRRDLSDLMDKFENVAGYRKEIDHALERIAAIERHLGINGTKKRART